MAMGDGGDGGDDARGRRPCVPASAQRRWSGAAPASGEARQQAAIAFVRMRFACVLRAFCLHLVCVLYASCMRFACALYAFCVGRLRLSHGAVRGLRIAVFSLFIKLRHCIRLTAITCRALRAQRAARWCACRARCAACHRCRACVARVLSGRCGAARVIDAKAVDDRGEAFVGHCVKCDKKGRSLANR